MLDGETLDLAGDIPPVLTKALVDHFEYAMGLRTGAVILFSEARLVRGGKWVHLLGASEDQHTVEMLGVDYCFDRGIDVRVSDIVWIADAPNGS